MNIMSLLEASPTPKPVATASIFKCEAESQVAEILILCVAQYDLELLMPLPLPQQCWNDRHAIHAQVKGSWGSIPGLPVC